MWSHPDKSLYSGEEMEGELVVSLVDLVKVFSQVLERRKEIPKFELRHDTVTIAQMMDRLRQRLIGIGRSRLARRILRDLRRRATR